MKYEIFLQTFAQTPLLTHCFTMCHTNILQCWYDCCQKYDMAYTAERRQLIWRSVDLHPLRGESESIFLSFIKMKKKKNLKKCTQHSMHIYKNIKWFPSTEYSWRLLFPCEISELAWNQPRAWAQTARSDCPKVSAWEKPWRTDTERVSHEECKGLKAWPHRSHRLY